MLGVGPLPWRSQHRDEFKQNIVRELPESALVKKLQWVKIVSDSNPLCDISFS